MINRITLGSMFGMALMFMLIRYYKNRKTASTRGFKGVTLSTGKRIMKASAYILVGVE